MAGKYSYLLKNIGLMTISNMSSKLLAFLLVPLYTSVLSTEEYGTYDLYTTTAFLLIPILSKCATEAVLRFALEGGRDSREVFSIGFKYFLRSSGLMAFFVVINIVTGLVPILNEYPLLYLLYYCTNPLSDLLSQFARGEDRVFDVAVAGILSSVVTIAMNILLLVVFPQGLNGYFIASCSAYILSALFLSIRLKIWRYFKSNNSRALEKEMISYSSPLVLNQISWWVNNSLAKYVILYFAGAAANGIYSVANKIPSMLSVFQTIFNQAWTLSAVREKDSDDGAFVTSIYRVYNCALVLLCSLLIGMDIAIARVLFANEFFVAWQYAPFLLISVVFGSLSGLLSGVFTAEKQTRQIARTTTVGTVINIALCIPLVFAVGPLGAAIANLMSYFVVWAVRFRAVRGIINLKVSIIKDISAYCILITQSIVLFVLQGTVMHVVEIAAFLILLMLYYSDVTDVISEICHRLGKRTA